MSINSKNIKSTYRIRNELFQRFHEKTQQNKQTKNGVIEGLIEDYVEGRSAFLSASDTKTDGSKKNHASKSK